MKKVDKTLQLKHEENSSSRRSNSSSFGESLQELDTYIKISAAKEGI